MHAGGFGGRNILHTQTDKKVRDVGRVREGNSATGTVIVYSEAKKGSAGRVCLEVKKFRQAGSEVAEIRKVTIFNSKVINNETESNITSFVTEKTGSGSLNVVIRVQLGDEPDLGEETGGADPVTAFDNVTVNIFFTRRVSFNKRGEAQFIEDGRGKSRQIYFDRLGLGEVSAKIKVRNISGRKMGVGGHDRV